MILLLVLIELLSWLICYLLTEFKYLWCKGKCNNCYNWKCRFFDKNKCVHFHSTKCNDGSCPFHGLPHVKDCVKCKYNKGCEYCDFKNSVHCIKI